MSLHAIKGKGWKQWGDHDEIIISQVEGGIKVILINIMYDL